MKEEKGQIWRNTEKEYGCPEWKSHQIPHLFLCLTLPPPWGRVCQLSTCSPLEQLLPFWPVRSEVIKIFIDIYIKSLCINWIPLFINCGTFGFDLSRPRNSSRTSSSLAISKSSKSLKNKFKLVIKMATSHPSKLLAVENLRRDHVALALLLFPVLPHERPLVLKNIWPKALNCWNTKDLRTWFPGNIISTSS